jgi:hypothetical protein
LVGHIQRRANPSRINSAFVKDVVSWLSQKVATRPEINPVATAANSSKYNDASPATAPQARPTNSAHPRITNARSALSGRDNHFGSGRRLSAARARSGSRFNSRPALRLALTQNAVQATGITTALRSAVCNRNTMQAVGSTKSNAMRRNQRRLCFGGSELGGSASIAALSFATARPSKLAASTIRQSSPGRYGQGLFSAASPARIAGAICPPLKRRLAAKISDGAHEPL